MSDSLYFRCRRFVDLDDAGQEIDDPNNYGYTFFNDSAEVFTVGLSKEEIMPILRADASDVVRILMGIDGDGDRASLLNSLIHSRGLYLNGRWNEWLDSAPADNGGS